MSSSPSLFLNREINNSVNIYIPIEYLKHILNGYILTEIFLFSVKEERRTRGHVITLDLVPLLVDLCRHEVSMNGANVINAAVVVDMYSCTRCQLGDTVLTVVSCTQGSVHRISGTN